LAEFDVFQTTENFANACHPNLIDIDPDSVLQEFQLVEPQIFQNDANDQDPPSDEEIQFFNYIMNSNVPDNALDHIMDEPMVQPVNTQSQEIPESATPDPIYNFIYETTSPVSLEETTPAPVVSSPASYTESSETNVTVVVPVGPAPLINLTFDPVTGALEEATSYGVPSPSSSIDSDQLSMTSSPGRPKIDNKERCKQYRQRTKNARKSAEDEVEKEKLRNIELTIKAERMEKQKKKMEKMILHFTKLNGKNHHEKKNLADQIKLAIGFLDI